MLRFEPGQDFIAQLMRKPNQLLCLLLGGTTRVIIFHRIPLSPASFQKVAIILPLRAQDDRQRLQRPVMGQWLLRPVALGIQQNRAQLERRIVGDAILPIGRDAAGFSILQVAPGDQPKIADFRGTSLMRAQPPVGESSLQIHFPSQ